MEADGIAAYKNKDVSFKFRGIDFEFALSQGLFSSAGIDAGTRFLLKVLSRALDEDVSGGIPLPKAVLDAGSGAGIAGICAVRALAVLAPDVRCRAQDRDELARLFTEYNARRNGLAPPMLEAFAEPLLGGPAGSRWDLILSNLPAKTGKPVLLDFISRSAALLNRGGKVLVVVVEPLADLLLGRIRERGLPLLRQEAAGGYRVFMYGPFPGEPPAGEPIALGKGFLERYPAYRRGAGTYEMEETAYTIEAFQGSAGFDSPGDAIRVAAKLVHRLAPALAAGLSLPVRTPGVTAGPSLLIHEDGQGHFPVWLAVYLGRRMEGADFTRLGWVLWGRNVLSLEAARHNLEAAGIEAAVSGAAGGKYRFIAFFPGQIAAWESLEALVEPAGIVLAALPSSDAERFDRKKPKTFRRLAEIRRRGFRALAYENLPL